MPGNWDEQEDVVAAGAGCPIPDCGVLAVTYRLTEGAGRADSKPWEFTCPALRNRLYRTRRRANSSARTQGMARGEGSRRIVGSSNEASTVSYYL